MTERGKGCIIGLSIQMHTIYLVQNIQNYRIKLYKLTKSKKIVEKKVEIFTDHEF